jgi:hypothetical protein
VIRVCAGVRRGEDTKAKADEEWVTKEVLEIDHNIPGATLSVDDDKWHRFFLFEHAASIS